MEVILLENVGRLGNVGDVVTIKGGYGRNFLVPAGKAVRATKANREAFEAQRAVLEKRDAEAKQDAEKRAKVLDGLTVKIVRQASEDGKLYGSVGVRDVSDAIEAQGHTIERRQVNLNEAIKFLGHYEANILLHSTISATINVEVVRSLEASSDQRRD